ncbi:hypothetical protein FBU30_004761 [Linnemannia zychae]|nr:hypothetical protein FBU30_004761 [Linnemannia zychae]
MTSSSPLLSSTQAAEALLNRARRLSHNANAFERSSRPTPSNPIAFAEGEELNLSPSFSTSSPRTSATFSTTTSRLPSPSLSPASCLSTASLHQKHRESFNDVLREHSRKRSSSVQRHSSASTASFDPLSSSDPSTSSTPSPPVTTTTESVDNQEQQQHDGQGPMDEGEDKTQQEQRGDRGQQDPLHRLQASTPPSSVALSSSLDNNNTSVSTNITTANAQTSTPSLVCPTIPQSNNTSSSTTTEDEAVNPSLARRSLTIVTRPRALTLESIRELRESNDPLSPSATSMTGVEDTLAPANHHRKHQSELGHHATLGLVRGVMEALRDSEQQQQQQLSNHTKACSTPAWALTLPAPSTPTSIPTTAFPQTDLVGMENKMNKDQAEDRTMGITPSSLPKQQNPTSPSLSATPTSTSIQGIHYQTILDIDNTDSSPSSLSRSPPPPPPKSALDLALGSSPPKSSPLRHNHVTPSETPMTAPPALSSPISPASSSAKGSRRPSKLLGKLVPKFLQTSFKDNNAGGSSSPRSAIPVSPLPLSAVARPTRSASFTSGTSAPSMATANMNSGSLRVADRNELPQLSILSDSIVSSNEDWLGLHSATTTTSATATVIPGEDKISTSAIATTTIKEQQQQPTVPSSSSGSNSTQFNMSIVAIEEQFEGSIHSNDSTPQFWSYTENNTQEERSLPVIPSPSHDHPNQDDSLHPHHRPFQQYSFDHNSNHHDNFEVAYHPHHYYPAEEEESPYDIDENCEDDFFRNSVLRKKKHTVASAGGPTHTTFGSAGRSTQPPLPLLSTGSWRGTTTTPSLSAASTSSRASSLTPSPTSPHSSMFASPTSTPISTTTATPSLLSRTNNNSYVTATTAPMIQPGLDEKRTRLRDAVGEWRRSANASLSSNTDESTSSPISTAYC